MTDATVANLVSLVVLVAVLAALAWAQEALFEKAVSQPFIERFVKVVKPFQPILVLLLAFAVNTYLGLDIISVVNKIAPLVTESSSDVGANVTSVLLALVSMYIHDKKP